MGKLASFSLLTAVILACSAAVRGDAACGDHGHINSTSNKCICDNTMPSPGQYGWAGHNCSMRVFGAQLDGSDVTSGCQSQNCGYLDPNQWMCFAFALDWKDTAHPWNHLTVELNRTNNNSRADPDLYGMFYGGSSHRDQILDTASFMYDFRETSSGSHARVVKSVEKSLFTSNSDYTGVWLCVKAYGGPSSQNATFSLKAKATLCPSDFDEEGRLTECSSRMDAPESEKHSSGCSADGTCQCKGPYQKPVTTVYPELGFEECSAKVVNVPDNPSSLSAFYVSEREQIQPKQWVFYAFNVTREDYQVVVNVAGDVAGECTKYSYMGLYAKYGQPPGARFNQYDARPTWDYYQSDDADMELKFDASMDSFQPGTWFAGVAGDDYHTCNYTITIDKFECPMNCNGHGSCDLSPQTANRTCNCNEGYFGDDCSMESARLMYNNTIRKQNQTFEYDYFDLPAITSGMVSHSVEIVLQASYSSQTYSYYSAARPELLVIKGDYSSYPTAGNYTYRAPLAQQNHTFEIALCPSQIQQGTWRAAIYNPLHIYRLDYNLTVIKKATCLNGCSGHGTCSEDGECVCSGGWLGGDCSVSPTGSCQHGSRLPQRMEAAHGTCWKACVCDGGAGGSCAYAQGSCADFTCDSALWRRKGTANECVQDQCTKDEWREQDSQVCLHKCTCPPSGDPCTVAPTCDATSFTCKPGYKRSASGEAKCFPEGCKEGTLQEADGQGVANGVGLAVCTCGAAESESTPACSFSTASSQGLAITCAPGYTLVGAKQQQGTHVMTGGRCVRSSSGTAWWGVLLWVMGTFVVGAAAGAAAWWWYMEYYGRGRGLSQALYSELSMGNDF